MSLVTINQADVDTLAAAVAGPVLRGRDPQAGEELGGFAPAPGHRADLVVGAASAQDVAAAVAFAERHGLAVTVHSTGHGMYRPADGGLVITTRRMQGVEIDPQARTARVEAGVRWESVVQAAAGHGLAALCGSAPSVGVVGYLVGGGIGPFVRTYGASADYVRSFEVVTADGALRQVGADHEPELFWALLGGGGAFCVVTAVVIELAPLTHFYGGGVYFPGEAAAELLHAYREWAPGLPETTTTSIAVLRLPPDPALPEPLRGQMVVHLRVGHVGPAEEGERLLAPMRGVARPLMDMITLRPYREVGLIHMDPEAVPVPMAENGLALAELPAKAVDALLDVAGPQSRLPLTKVEIRHVATGRVKDPSTLSAVTMRDAVFCTHVVAAAPPGLEEVTNAAVGSLMTALEPYGTGRTPYTFLGPGDDAGRTGWPAPAVERVATVKRTYDPRNILHSGRALPDPADMS
ncbi:FAD/FMN-containing dehydrogenase [Thermomonospora echinospora]|uniref:FAD/FMN-containing dehydrogenase n=1 Tax=Thermomonospora echinospora TaxID=1992 RepID=A0A1H6C904_9ACTN|nr:FAD-binding oxidoreductase [Thermomonospora echinospora]SEG69382.1 FAD/FMN-containing dehydrogenase [Thermomonospora echinospora]